MTGCIPVTGISLFSDRVDQHRVILIVQLRLNPITRLDVFHYLGSFVGMQPHFLTVPPP